jgi:hypothetical protein
MEHGVSCVKRARLLSQNQIREIVMDLDSNEEKYSASEDMEDDEQQRCCVCSARGVTRIVLVKCVKCDMAVCVDRSCFEDYHTKKRILRPLFVRSQWKMLELRPQCK